MHPSIDVDACLLPIGQRAYGQGVADVVWSGPTGNRTWPKSGATHQVQKGAVEAIAAEASACDRDEEAVYSWRWSLHG